MDECLSFRDIAIARRGWTDGGFRIQAMLVFWCGRPWAPDGHSAVGLCRWPGHEQLIRGLPGVCIVEVEAAPAGSDEAAVRTIVGQLFALGLSDVEVAAKPAALLDWFEKRHPAGRRQHALDRADDWRDALDTAWRDTFIDDHRRTRGLVPSIDELLVEQWTVIWRALDFFDRYRGSGRSLVERFARESPALASLAELRLDAAAAALRLCQRFDDVRVVDACGRAQAVQTALRADPRNAAEVLAAARTSGLFEPLLWHIRSSDPPLVRLIRAQFAPECATGAMLLDGFPADTALLWTLLVLTNLANCTTGPEDGGRIVLDAVDDNELLPNLVLAAAGSIGDGSWRWESRRQAIAVVRNTGKGHVSEPGSPLVLTATPLMRSRSWFILERRASAVDLLGLQDPIGEVRQLVRQREIRGLADVA